MVFRAKLLHNSAILSAHRLVVLSAKVETSCKAAADCVIDSYKDGSYHFNCFISESCSIQRLNDSLCMQDSSSPRGNPKCIVLCPTRELAKQVEKEFQASGPSLKVACLYGGTAIHLLTSHSLTL